MLAPGIRGVNLKFLQSGILYLWIEVSLRQDRWEYRSLSILATLIQVYISLFLTFAFGTWRQMLREDGYARAFSSEAA